MHVCAYKVFTCIYEKCVFVFELLGGNIECCRLSPSDKVTAHLYPLYFCVSKGLLHFKKYLLKLALGTIRALTHYG